MRAFVIGRPYHIFNAINCVISTGISGDAFILNEYPLARRDFERVRVAGIFARVYFVEESSQRPKGLLNEAVYVCKRGVFPWRTIQNALGKQELSKERAAAYAEVYSATPGSFVLALLDISKAKLVILEDGTGTYSGKDFLEHQSIKHRLYCALFHNGAMNVHIERVLVYKPEICKTELAGRVEQLPYICEQNHKLMSAFDKVFDYSNDDYNREYIFLSQRLLGLNCPDIDLFGLITDAFLTAGISNYCYRLHPAEQRVDYAGKACSFPDELWELICMKYVHDDSVLITINSTAAFSPFKLFNREPFLIFIHRVVGLHDYDYQVSEELVKTLQESYSDPSKIFIPNSKAELCQVLSGIRERKNNSVLSL